MYFVMNVEKSAAAFNRKSPQIPGRPNHKKSSRFITSLNKNFL